MRRIVLEPGTYALDAELSISRDVVLEAARPGTVVLAGQGSARILSISAGMVDLIGLNITNGRASYGGGVFIYSGDVTFTRCSIYSNTADQTVIAPLQ